MKRTHKRLQQRALSMAKVRTAEWGFRMSLFLSLHPAQNETYGLGAALGHSQRRLAFWDALWHWLLELFTLN